MRVGARSWFVPVLLALSLGGCGKSPDSASTVTGGAPAAAENFAREAPDAGKVEQVTITATGQGKSLGAAVNQAILLAVQQVNGTTVDASSVQLDAGAELAIGNKQLDIRSSAFADLVGSRTHGTVSSFRVLSQEQDRKSGVHEVSIEAKIAKFTNPASANRLRLAVAALRLGAGSYVVDATSVPADRVAQQIRQNLANALSKTGRLAVLDREFSTEVDSELALIESGKMPKDDLARVGQRLATDYLLVGRIERFGYPRRERELRASGRTLVSHSGGAALSMRLINVTTGQVEQSDTVTITLPETEPTTLVTKEMDTQRVISDLAAKLSSQAAQRIITHLFPVTVVSIEGDDVVLSQSGESLGEKQYYEIVSRGKELKDPQTGQSLGRVEKPCCVVLVTKVTPQLSYGTLVQKQIDVAAAFAPGALELRGVVSAPAGSAGTAKTRVQATAAHADSEDDEAAPKPVAKPKKSTKDEDW